MINNSVCKILGNRLDSGAWSLDSLEIVDSLEMNYCLFLFHGGDAIQSRQLVQLPFPSAGFFLKLSLVFLVKVKVKYFERIFCGFAMFRSGFTQFIQATDRRGKRQFFLCRPLGNVMSVAI